MESGALWGASAGRGLGPANGVERTPDSMAPDGHPALEFAKKSIKKTAQSGSYGNSVFSAALLPARGPTVPRRAFKDCGCPLRIAA